eukprot:9369600-Pyramimonas_sp.AAC.1
MFILLFHAPAEEELGRGEEGLAQLRGAHAQEAHVVRGEHLPLLDVPQRPVVAHALVRLVVAGKRAHHTF